jgi:hypothetical protein
VEAASSTGVDLMQSTVNFSADALDTLKRLRDGRRYQCNPRTDRRRECRTKGSTRYQISIQLCQRYFRPEFPNFELNKMTTTDVEIQNIIERCGEVSSMACVYDELIDNYPDLNGDGLRDKFLSMLRELLLRRKLQFRGEAQIFRGDEVPRENSILRFDLMPNIILNQIILQGQFWQSSDEQRRQIADRLMFDIEVFGADETIIKGLRQPPNDQVQTIVGLIQSKWPSQLVPENRQGDGGFDRLWFDKWVFNWVDTEA